MVLTSREQRRLKEGIKKVFKNPDVKEAGNGFTSNPYRYVNMELTLDWGGDRPKFSRVKKRLKDANERPIVIANENPILDSHMYEVEYNDGHTESLEANLITDDLFTHVHQAGNRFTILDSITGKRAYGTQVLQQYEFVHTSTGTKIRVNTTNGWEICIQWKNGSTTWNTLKHVKYSYPFHMAEFAVENRIS